MDTSLPSKLHRFVDADTRKSLFFPFSLFFFSFFFTFFLWQLGFKTACVESRGKLGGTCLNVGCIPSKALLNASHKYHDLHTNSYEQFGVKTTGVTLDLAKMLKQKDDAVTGLTGGIEYLFKKNNVKYFKGKGSFTGPKSLNVALAAGGTDQIEAKNIVIATGSDVMDLPGVKRDEVHIVSSTGALSINKVPKNMLVIGGGVIGLELGSVWSRLGSEVTVVEFMDAIAAGADKEVATNFMRILKKQGLKFELQQKVTKAVVNGDGVDVTIEKRDGGATRVERFEKVLVSIGRRPYTDGLGLDKAGVKLDERGRVHVDDQLRTNVPGIFAIGDVVRGPMLAHKAEDEVRKEKEKEKERKER